MGFTFASISTLSQLSGLVQDISLFTAISIHENGELQAPTKPASLTRLFYGHIEFSGELEPVTGKKGLALLPNIILYNGLHKSFFESFRHYSENPSLQEKIGMFLEPDSLLSWNDKFFEIAGRGGLCLWFPSANTQVGGFNIFQYRAGEKFHRNNLPVLPILT